MKKYVYKGKEVFLTGRTASKRGIRGKEKIIHEIKPVRYFNDDRDTVHVAEWVGLGELFQIDENESDIEIFEDIKTDEN